MSCLKLYRTISGRSSESIGRFSMTALMTCECVHQNTYRISSSAVWFKLSLFPYHIFCCTAYHCTPVFCDFYPYSKIAVLNYANIHNEKKKHFTSHITVSLPGLFWVLTPFRFILLFNNLLTQTKPHFPLHKFLNQLLQHTIQIKEEDRYMCFHSCRWNPETK